MENTSSSNYKRIEYEEKLAEVMKIYNHHHIKNNGCFLGGATSAKYAGFRYYRTFEESILFDNDNEIIQIDEEHVPETKAYLKIK